MKASEMAQLANEKEAILSEQEVINICREIQNAAEHGRYKIIYGIQHIKTIAQLRGWGYIVEWLQAHDSLMPTQVHEEYLIKWG